MEFKKLDNKTVDLYLDYLKQAMAQEPDMMTADVFDEEGIRQRVNDEFYQRTPSILAICDGRAVGRIEYHFYGCLQDGYRMAYVDWVYVLKEFRHKGIARKLFKELEKDCAEHDIDQYYLIRAENENADRFYKRFENAELSNSPLLRKELK